VGFSKNNVKGTTTSQEPEKLAQGKGHAGKLRKEKRIEACLLQFTADGANDPGPGRGEMLGHPKHSCGGDQAGAGESSRTIPERRKNIRNCIFGPE